MSGFFIGHFLSEKVPDDHADNPRVEENGKISPYLGRQEAKPVELGEDQHDKAYNKEQVAELGL